MVIYTDKGYHELSWNKDHFYFIDKPSPKRNPGYPLDSSSIIPEFNKYLVELNDEEKEQYKKNHNINHVIKFITKSI